MKAGQEHKGGYNFTKLMINGFFMSSSLFSSILLGSALTFFCLPSFASKHVLPDEFIRDSVACNYTGRVLSKDKWSVQCGDDRYSKVTLTSSDTATQLLISMYQPYEDSAKVFYSNLQSSMKLLDLNEQEESEIKRYVFNDGFGLDGNKMVEIGSVKILRPTRESSANYGNYILLIVKKD